MSEEKNNESVSGRVGQQTVGEHAGKWFFQIKTEFRGKEIYHDVVGPYETKNIAEEKRDSLIIRIVKRLEEPNIDWDDK